MTSVGKVAKIFALTILLLLTKDAINIVKLLNMNQNVNQ